MKTTYQIFALILFLLFVLGCEKELIQSDPTSISELDNTEEVFSKTVTYSWQRMPGHLKQISVGSEVWGVNYQDEIYKWNGSGWTIMPGHLKHVSVGDDGEVWGVNSEDEIYTWTGSGWHYHTIGHLKQISVGDDHNIWGVNSLDMIYKWGIYVYPYHPWMYISGELKHVSVGYQGYEVWGVNSNDWIYRWDALWGWERMPGQLKQISVGSGSAIWGVNSEDEIYKWNNSSYSWVRITPGHLKYISVNYNGSVWGVNSEDEIYKLVKHYQSNAENE